MKRISIEEKMGVVPPSRGDSLFVASCWISYVRLMLACLVARITLAGFFEDERRRKSKTAPPLVAFTLPLWFVDLLSTDRLGRREAQEER